MVFVFCFASGPAGSKCNYCSCLNQASAKILLVMLEHATFFRGLQLKLNTPGFSLHTTNFSYKLSSFLRSSNNRAFIDNP